MVCILLIKYYTDSLFVLISLEPFLYRSFHCTLFCVELEDNFKSVWYATNCASLEVMICRFDLTFDHLGLHHSISVSAKQLLCRFVLVGGWQCSFSMPPFSFSYRQQRWGRNQCAVIDIVFKYRKSRPPY